MLFFFAKFTCRFMKPRGLLKQVKRAKYMMNLLLLGWCLLALRVMNNEERKGLE